MSFKEDDWVRLSYRYDDSTKNTIEKLRHILDTRYVFDSSINGRNFANKDRATLTLWKPKENEWCWFWGGNDKPVLSTFVKYTRLLGYVSKGEWYQKENTGWQYCEPFIGELPSYLKKD